MKYLHMKNYFTLLCLLVTLCLNAQDHPGCNGSRFVEDVFTDVDSTFAVYYGSGYTIGGDSLGLYMDVFEPQNDPLAERPVLIFAYGGSYIGGERSDVHWIARRYARKGFVVACIDYRLYDLPLFPLPTAEEMMDVVTRSVHDMRGAVRFLRADADTNNLFNVDPNWVFVGGISAGAITAMHTAHIDDEDEYSQTLIDIFDNLGGLEGTVNTLDYSSDVQGAVSLSGGLNMSQWIDDNDPPFISVHEDGDGTVPYGPGFANIFGFDIIAMDGSFTCHQVAESVGIKNRLKTYVSSQHVGYLFSETQTNEVVNLSAAFLHDLMCEDQVLSTSNISTENISISPNPFEEKLIIALDGIQNASLEVFTVMGRLVSTKTLESPESTLKTDDLEEGVYFFVVKSEGKLLHTQKLIKF